MEEQFPKVITVHAKDSGGVIELTAADIVVVIFQENPSCGVVLELIKKPDRDKLMLLKEEEWTPPGVHASGIGWQYWVFFSKRQGEAVAEFQKYSEGTPDKRITYRFDIKKRII
ncbi:hypothetical protein H1S01_19750 [Heliobacterium chlorum]|uniref:Proteinase inhibitor I42 chagasin domain-containing protein n=1 Tax=Heliobacterium chlorum TaxID=2698 RepID=A0ABR7T7E2_HELCL|nr:hypothetical protein [Heliobacterium chlorum]MBC9786679.1 hypothetical protein [Heliobacterium chlorum]